MKLSRIIVSVATCVLTGIPVQTMHAQVFILTNDQQLRDLANSPEKEIDNTIGFNKSKLSLKQAAEQAQNATNHTT